MLVKSYGYQLKINTVVHQGNYKESMVEFINYAKPQRWKVFQVLPMKGENDKYIKDFIINKIMFKRYIANHHQLKNDKIMVTENNEEMKDSYVMIDPAGRFYTNKNGLQEYSNPILETDINSAYESMNYNYKNFQNRGGLYQWNIKK